jgi:carbon storage regulator
MAGGFFRYQPFGALEAQKQMLVLTRRSNQSIMIGDDVEVTVLAVAGEKVRLGISAPTEVPVFRREVFVRIAAERAEEEERTPVPAE